MSGGRFEVKKQVGGEERSSLCVEELLVIWRILDLKTCEWRSTALKWGNCVFVSKHIELIHYGKEMK